MSRPRQLAAVPEPHSPWCVVDHEEFPRALHEGKASVLPNCYQERRLELRIHEDRTGEHQIELLVAYDDEEEPAAAIDLNADMVMELRRMLLAELISLACDPGGRTGHVDGSVQSIVTAARRVTSRLPKAS